MVIEENNTKIAEFLIKRHLDLNEFVCFKTTQIYKNDVYIVFLYNFKIINEEYHFDLKKFLNTYKSTNDTSKSININKFWEEINTHFCDSVIITTREEYELEIQKLRNDDTYNKYEDYNLIER
jgi:hypothetical protein